MNPEELKKRTKEFAHRCVKLPLALSNTKLGSHIQGQLTRCSTSVAANYRATCLAQTRAVFAKISIVLEEVDESAFWLEFIIEKNLLKRESVKSLLNEAHELTSIFGASRRTAQTQLKQKTNHQ